jgi:hypothetical protein
MSSKKYRCPCGASIQERSKAKHLKSKKHETELRSICEGEGLTYCSTIAEVEDAKIIAQEEDMDDIDDIALTLEDLEDE